MMDRLPSRKSGESVKIKPTDIEAMKLVQKKLKNKNEQYKKKCYQKPFLRGIEKRILSRKFEKSEILVNYVRLPEIFLINIPNKYFS
jgi:hypothetical protein